METLRRSVVLVALFVLAVSSATAQVISEGQEAMGFGLPTQAEPDRVEELKTIVAVLRLPPLNPREVCHLWERYAAGHVLERNIAGIPTLVETLGTSKQEIQKWQTSTAQRLADVLSVFLKYKQDELPLPKCQYWDNLGERNTIFPYDLSLRDTWDLVSLLRRIKGQYNLPSDNFKIMTEENIDGYLRDFIKGDGGKKYLKKWAEGGEEGYWAVKTLRTWIVDLRYAPSTIGLTPEQTAKLFEEDGKK